jgi:PIN domain nuclease of toxin-antitoxin system
VKLILDTHLLLHAALGRGLSAEADRLLAQADAPIFSAASIWEVAIKRGLGRPDFTADPAVLRRALLDNGYQELAVTSAHAAAVLGLPPIHKDPFDRILVAQATLEGITLATSDAMVARYPGPIRRL